VREDRIETKNSNKKQQQKTNLRLVRVREARAAASVVNGELEEAVVALKGRQEREGSVNRGNRLLEVARRIRRGVDNRHEDVKRNDRMSASAETDSGARGQGGLRGRVIVTKLRVSRRKGVTVNARSRIDAE
jgi:hypothetical protein